MRQKQTSILDKLWPENWHLMHSGESYDSEYGDYTCSESEIDFIKFYLSQDAAYRREMHQQLRKGQMFSLPDNYWLETDEYRAEQERKEKANELKATMTEYGFDIDRIRSAFQQAERNHADEESREDWICEAMPGEWQEALAIRNERLETTGRKVRQLATAMEAIELIQ